VTGTAQKFLDLFAHLNKALIAPLVKKNRMAPVDRHAEKKKLPRHARPPHREKIATLRLGPCLDPFKMQKVFKISRHIAYADIFMEY
jgi:hypothetical protein